jgi:hypothetical protein
VANTDPFTAWVNQGGASSVISGGLVRVRMPGTQGAGPRARVKTMGVSSNYTAIVGVIPTLLGATSHCGLILQQAAAGAAQNHQTIFGLWGDGNLRVSTYNNGSFNSHIVALAWLGYGALTPFWLKAVDDGTNLVFYVGHSPATDDWDEVVSMARATWQTADRVGIYADTNNSTSFTGATLSVTAFHLDLP